MRQNSKFLFSFQNNLALYLFYGIIVIYLSKKGFSPAYTVDSSPLTTPWHTWEFPLSAASARAAFLMKRPRLRGMEYPARVRPAFKEGTHSSLWLSCRPPFGFPLPPFFAHASRLVPRHSERREVWNIRHRSGYSMNKSTSIFFII